MNPHSAPLADAVRAGSQANADELDALADQLAERLAPRLVATFERMMAGPDASASALVDAETVAAALGVSRAYVYEHADELGAERLGDGPRARLRFDLERARAATARSERRRSEGSESQTESGSAQRGKVRKRPRLPNGLPEPGSVLRPRAVDSDRSAA